VKIEELIKILQKYPSELEVLVDGYENGFDDIEEFRIKRLRLQKLDESKDYDGDYEESEVAKNNNLVFEAIILSRKGF